MPPKKRTSLRARAAASNKPSSLQLTTSNIATTNPFLPQTKTSKRKLRHTNLLHRVREAGIQKSSSTTKKGRRRAGKKLKAAEDVSGLRDALPDISPQSSGSESDVEEEWEGISDFDEAMDSGLQRLTQRRRRRNRDTATGKIVMKSLNHCPGAMKRKRVLEQKEVDRFGRNLAQMAQPITSASLTGREGGGGGGGAGQSERWAALRKFIGGTMVRDGAFAKGLGVGGGVG